MTELAVVPVDDTHPKPRVLVVDDNEDILNNLKVLLEFNDFDVIAASNGKVALKLLERQENMPDVILSDIMMPEMDGYDFFKELSREPATCHIPFVFLTAKSSPEDVRLAKMLGADDYIIKPFNQDDLLAILSGKIARNRRITIFNSELKELMPSLASGSKVPPGGSTLCIIHAEWDDKVGPVLVRDLNVDADIQPNNLAYRLFNMARTIYGEKLANNAESVLLTLVNINKQAFIMFDMAPDASKRTRYNFYMLGAIAPRINFLESLIIKKEFQQASVSIKSGTDWDIKRLHDKLIAELSW